MAAVAPGRPPDKQLTDAADAVSLLMHHASSLDRRKLKHLIAGLPALERRRVGKRLAELRERLE
jgi:hypothetical protein